jgi:hypothetical protein
MMNIKEPDCISAYSLDSSPEYENTERKFQATIGVGGGAVFATDELFKYIDDGFFIDATARYFIEEQVYVGVYYAFPVLHLEITNIEFFRYAIIDDYTPGYDPDVSFEFDLGIHEAFVLIGAARYPKSNDLPIGYAEVGFGSIFYTVKPTVYVDGELYEGDFGDPSKGVFGFLGRIGIIGTLYGWLGFDLSGSILMTYGEGEIGNVYHMTGKWGADDTTGKLWSVRMGLFYYFNNK